MVLLCSQTCLLRKIKNNSLENLLRITVENAECENAELYLNNKMIWNGSISGSVSVDCWIEEPSHKENITLSVKVRGNTVSEVFSVDAPKHFEVHLVHLSHADPGYTDLMSHVFELHSVWIDKILDEMDKRDDYPYDERLRITIEQFWLLENFLEHAPKDRIDKLINRIKKGDIEITALYGNLITEQLGHEECYRAMYPARRFGQLCGRMPITASHCDIPGVSWGLCRALCDAEIKFLAADFPSYYDNWGSTALVPFWNSKKAFGYDGPGACMWKSPDGKKLLLWDSHTEIAESWDDKWIENLADRLVKNRYPYDVYRATVKAWNIDNSCYIPDYADGALKWNKKYAYPHIVVSTNEMFYRAFTENAEKMNIPIPEVKGDLPGQDYPTGAMSMAPITSSARKTQKMLATAQKLYTLTADDSFVKNQDLLLEEAWRDLLIADDHAYGFHFSAGPAMKASYFEKGLRAMRAEATTQDIMDKALSSIADRIKDDGTELRLVVFNTSGKEKRCGVEVMMRELDNCGTVLCTNNSDSTKMKGYNLYNRRRVNPKECYWNDSLFKLIDLDTKKEVPYYIEEIEWDEPDYYAPERAGLGSGTARYGFFELPGGLKRVMRFVAEDLPAFGYKCYAFVPNNISGATVAPKGVNCIENGLYRINLDSRGICSIIDLRTNKELLDIESPHRLGEVLVRTGRKAEPEIMKVKRIKVRQNSIYSEIKMFAEVDGAHEVSVKVVLWNKIDRVQMSIHMLRSAKPLQTMLVAFPFSGNGFKYQGTLCEIQPGDDFLPEAQCDFLTVKDYVLVKGNNILWSSRDTAVVALGDLWPGYISPAHSCIMEYNRHKPLKKKDFEKSGRIYALLTANNFGTNFMCSQSFDGVYKFSFGLFHKQGDEGCASWGEGEQNPVITQFTDRSRGNLPYKDSLLDSDELHCLMLKKAENGTEFVTRLWNHSEQEKPVRLRIKGQEISEMTLCNALEEEIASVKEINVKPKTVATVKFSIK